MLTESPSDAVRPPAVRATLLAWLGVTLAVGVLDPLSVALPWVHSNLGGIAALLFLLVPGRVAPPGHPLWDPVRTALRGARTVFGPTVLVVALTAAAFVPAYHVYATSIRGEAARWSATALLRPAERFVGAPASRQRDTVYLWDNGGEIVVTLSSAIPTEIVVQTDGNFVGAQLPTSPRELRATTDGLTRPASVRATPRDASVVRVTATRAGETVDLPMRVGTTARLLRPDAENAWTVPLRAWWIFAFVIVHLLLVAFPEEFFYRAFVLPSLGGTRWGQRGLGIGGVRLTAANVATSLLFALAHFAVGLDPSRLAVFFPSLVFGLLREKTGSIAGGIVYHAFCNVLLQVVALQYVAS